MEDPDGFYGIPTTDVLSGLRQRLRHEGDHWRAFGIDSALAEATSGGRGQSEALSDLQSLGFNRTAIALAGASASVASNDHLYAELAWRTGDWDLPVSSNDQGILFSALRAVHRTQDLDAARREVFKAVSNGLTALHNLDVQRLSEIKTLVAELLCLREVAVWVTEPTHLALLGGHAQGAQLLCDTPDILESVPLVHRRLLTDMNKVLECRARPVYSTISTICSIDSQCVYARLACHL